MLWKETIVIHLFVARGHKVHTDFFFFRNTLPADEAFVLYEIHSWDQCFSEKSLNQLH